MSNLRVIRRVAAKAKKKGQQMPVLDVKRMNSHTRSVQFPPYTDKDGAKMLYGDHLMEAIKDE